MKPWTQVVVTNPDHDRYTQGGVVTDELPDQPNKVGVKFDLADSVEVVAVADLKALT